MGISGEDVFHRMITFKDKTNNQHDVRIMIRTVAFKVKDIKWEKDLNSIDSQL